MFSESTLHISLRTRVFRDRWTSGHCSRWKAAWLNSIWVNHRDGSWKNPYPHPILSWGLILLYTVYYDITLYCLEVWILCLLDTTYSKHNLLVPDDVGYKKFFITNAVLNQSLFQSPQLNFTNKNWHQMSQIQFLNAQIMTNPPYRFQVGEANAHVQS